MLSICSVTPACASNPQVSFQIGLRPLSPLVKAINVSWIVEDRVGLGVPSGCCTREVSLKTQATKFAYSHVTGRPEVSGSLELTNIPSYLKELDGKQEFLNNWSGSTGAINGPNSVERGDFSYVENSSVSALEDKVLNVPDQFMQSTNILEGDVSGTISTFDDTVNVSENTTSVSDSLVVSNDALAKLTSNLREYLSGVNASIDDLVEKGDDAVKNTFDTITSSIADTVKSITEATDHSVTNLWSSINHNGELAGDELTGISGNLEKATSNAGSLAINILRQTILTIEDYLASGTGFAVYYYGSAKELLPQEVQNVLNLTEDKAEEFLRPVKTILKEVYIAIEGLETTVGLDTNDPLISFALFLGTSATLWVSYWAFTYGGYSGDLSPASTLELLKREENVVLIDVRPEALKERDGVPDIRRGARFRYANITLPEIDGSVKKLLVRERDLEDSLTAAVIRNLKIVRDGSKVIVMDADGTRSKGIARSLRKLGVKRPYLVHGGFLSWVKNGLRIKELKPETALSILNEEAEAILEDIRPTPLQVAGYGVGSVAAIYALLEWERTLQLIGIIGLGQTIYRRIASYEDSNDFKQDVRLLVAPVRLGADAFSWAAKKLEPNKIGLPTSPSSSAVQDRVLQAAAKHESQPSDTEETTQDLSQESPTPPVEDNMTRSGKFKTTKKYSRSSSSYYQGGLFRKGGGLNKYAKSSYYFDIKSDYDDYYYDKHDDDDDECCIISKKGSSSSSSSSFKETTTATNNTTTTSALDINNDNVGEELEWMMVIFVCDSYEEEPIKRYDVSLRYISSSSVFQALVRNCGHKFGVLISQGCLVLHCSIRYFESVYNLSMCQAEEEEEEKEKAHHLSI